MFGLGFVVRLKNHVSGGNQICLCFNTVGVIINDAPAPLTKLAVHRLLDFHEFFGGQLRQIRFDFRNCTHAQTVYSGR